MWSIRVIKFNESYTPEMLSREILDDIDIDLDEAETSALVSTVYDGAPPRYIGGPESIIKPLSAVFQKCGYEVEICRDDNNGFDCDAKPCGRLNAGGSAAAPRGHSLGWRRSPQSFAG
jgi:hypothetical protein